MAQRSARILIVDDEYSVRDSLLHWFLEDGHVVRAAENANWAIERFEEEYEFRYDPDVTHITLRLMRSIARFHEGEYTSSYADVVVLDDLLGLGLPQLNTGAPDFVAKLMKQIQTVREASGGGLL